MSLFQVGNVLMILLGVVLIAVGIYIVAEAFPILCVAVSVQ